MLGANNQQKVQISKKNTCGLCPYSSYCPIFTPLLLPTLISSLLLYSPPSSHLYFLLHHQHPTSVSCFFDTSSSFSSNSFNTSFSFFTLTFLSFATFFSLFDTASYLNSITFPFFDTFFSSFGTCYLFFSISSSLSFSFYLILLPLLSLFPLDSTYSVFCFFLFYFVYRSLFPTSSSLFSNSPSHPALFPPPPCLSLHPCPRSILSLSPPS